MNEWMKRSEGYEFTKERKWMCKELERENYSKPNEAANICLRLMVIPV